MIPLLDERGLLPRGIHAADWSEIVSTFGWNPHRQRLISNAKIFSQTTLHSLAGFPLILGGSTFSDKPMPPDIEMTIRVDVTTMTANQMALCFRLQSMHDSIKSSQYLDFYVTLLNIGSDFVDFFQYVGEKTANAKNIHKKDRRGVIEVARWTHG